MSSLFLQPLKMAASCGRARSAPAVEEDLRRMLAMQEEALLPVISKGAALLFWSGC